MASRSRVKDIDKGWRSIVDELSTLSKSDVFVGINEGNFAARAQEEGQSEDFTMAQIGAVHEFGTLDRRVPPRPWLRSAVDSQRAQISKFIGNMYSDILKRIRSADEALNRLGLLGVNIVRHYMLVTGPAIWLALSPLTIEAKGSDKPLVDTGQLVGSVTYVVKVRGKTVAKSKPQSGKQGSAGAKRASRRSTKSRKARAKKRRFVAKNRRSEALKEVLADRRDRKRSRKAATRARQKARKSARIVARRANKRQRRLDAKVRKKDRIVALRLRKKERKTLSRLKKKTRKKERKIALRFRKKDRATLSRLRKRDATKARKRQVKVNRVTRKKRSVVNAKFRALDKLLKKLAR